MMPKLPPPTTAFLGTDDEDGFEATGFTKEQMLAYARAVAEVCAAKCDAVASAPSSLWEEHGCWSHAAENCAAAIRKLKEEIGR